jgi:hypothetical protein
MFIEVSRAVRKDCPKDLLGYPPVIKKTLDIVQKYLSTESVEISLDENPKEGFVMICRLSWPHKTEVESISITYRNYKSTNHLSYTMSFKFEDLSIFSGIYDSESCGKTPEEVLINLLNGHRAWMESFANSLVGDAAELASKVPEHERGQKSMFQSREYI